jgi:arylsulfatase A-like enzyme
MKISGRILLVLLIIFLAGGLVLNVRTQKKDSTSQPFLCNGKPCNVILIAVDTLSARHMSLYGYERETTPFIDEFFGKNGIIFTNAWSNSTWTLPSFVSLWTSQYVESPFALKFIRDSTLAPHLQNILRVHGVTLQAFVRSMYDKNDNSSLAIISPYRESELFTAQEPLQFLAANEWLQERSKKNINPFFLLVHTWYSHHPYGLLEKYKPLFDAPQVYPSPIFTQDIQNAQKEILEGKPFAEKERFIRQYDQNIRHTDDQVKQFIEKIPKELLNRSVVILVSDHGEAFGEHEFLSHGFPPYEEVIHVPFAIWFPDSIQRKITENVSLLTVSPTILSIFGISSPESFLGESILPQLQGKPMPDIVVKSLIDTPRWLNILDNQTLQEMIPEGLYVAYRKKDWKLLVRPVGKDELYNLQNDPLEQTNLIDSWKSLSTSDQEIIRVLFQEAQMQN